MDQSQEQPSNLPSEQPTKPYKPRKVRKPELTPKQRRFVKLVAAGKNKGQAAIEAGYAPASASVTAARTLKLASVQGAIQSVWDKCGLTDDFIGQKVKELSTAKKTQFFAKDGIVTDERTVEDTAVQRSSIELAARLKGLLVDRSVSVNVSIDISPVDLTRYRKERSVDNCIDVVDNPVDNSVTNDIKDLEQK